jgi:hypothetical protein
VIPGWFSIVIVTPNVADLTAHGVGVFRQTCPITVVNRPATRPTTLA